MNRDTSAISYILYCRKSTEGKERQILSILGQRQWAVETGRRMGVRIECVLEEEKSAEAPFKRPIFDKMIRDIRRSRNRGIITWKMDRLARNPEEAGIVLGLLKRGEIERIITAEREYRPEDNALISYVDFGMADQYVRDLSRNVKRGLKTKAELGWCPTFTRLGYLNTKTDGKGANSIIKDPERFDLLKRAWKLLLTGAYTVPEVARMISPAGELTTRPTRTAPARAVARSTWYRIFTDPFYAGRFEYPRGSGNWYRGKHEPMITEEQFDLVQELLGSKGRPRTKRRRTFDFTGLFRCGTCDAAITAEAKTKRQKNGITRHYVYYHCTKRKNPECPERSIEAREFERQIDRILAEITISDAYHARAIEELRLAQLDDDRIARATLASRSRALTQVTQQIDNLLRKYTSPENADGLLFTDEEFVALKARLAKQRVALESQIHRHGELERQRDEQAAQTFRFAARSREAFARGTRDSKRAIITGLGSNRTIKDKTVAVELHFPLQTVAQNRVRVERELAQVRTSNNGSTERWNAALSLLCPTLRGVVDYVRTSLHSPSQETPSLSSGFERDNDDEQLSMAA